MERAKILHFSDFHNGYEQLEKFIEYANSRTDIDTVLFSGDILGQCLSGKQLGEMGKSLETMVQGTLKECGKKEIRYDDAVKYCRRAKDKKLRQAYKNYRRVERSYHKTSKKHYKRFKKEISRISQKVMIIPGNWDTPLFKKIFSKYSIHKKKKKIHGLRIVGYGTGGFMSKYTPPTKAFDYDDKKFGKFLEKKKPDIILSHMPPKGICDGSQEIGSSALAKYLKKKRKRNPLLVCCGHAHGYDSAKTKGTLVVNAGNLGKYFNSKNCGTFAEIEINDRNVSVNHYQIKDDGIHKLRDEV